MSKQEKEYLELIRDLVGGAYDYILDLDKLNDDELQVFTSLMLRAGKYLDRGIRTEEKKND